MMKKITLLTITCLMTNLFLFAQTGATGETTLYNELKKVDNELNVVYKQTLKKLSTNNRKILKDEQRLWIIDQDASCSKDQDGSVNGNKLRLDCLIQETLKRTGQLRNWNTRKKT
jgi:uncharacterized protein YecT (DUF1311 family)